MNGQNANSRNITHSKTSKNNKNADLKLFLSKIKKEPMFNAFGRKSLGSIPSKFDNFLFNLDKEKKPNSKYFKLKKKFKEENNLYINDIFIKDHSSWKNYGTGNNIEFKGNVLKFSVNNDLKNLGKKSEFDSKNIDSFKSFYSYSNPINTNKSTSLTNNIDINNRSLNDSHFIRRINKNRSVPKMKFSKEDRYFNIYYKNEIIEKYLPGPADYSPEKDLDKHNYRYYSLFKAKSSFPLIEIKSTTAGVGPGSYDLLKEKNIPGGTFSKLKKYANFNNPFIINDKDIKTNFGANNLPGSINIKDIFRKNYFFMINSPRKEKLEKKLGLIRNDNDKGKGKEINKNINEKKNKNVNWVKGKSINIDWINSKLEKKIKEKLKEGNILYENIDEHDNECENIINQINNNDKQIIKKRGKMFSFNKIPRFFEPSSKHVPGPSYYDPEKILQGIKLVRNFNAKEDNWI